MSEISDQEEVSFSVYTVCWNEVKLLPFFCRYYSEAKKIYIFDNESDDNSSEIASQFDNVVFIPFSTGGTLNDDINRHIKNTEWKNPETKGRVKTNFVIVQDLDEFLYFPNFPNDIPAALKDGQKKGITLFHCKGFQMYCDDSEFNTLLPDQYMTTSITSYSTEENGWYDKMICFDSSAITDINYYPGAHVAVPKGNVNVDNKSSYLLHYRFLGKEYVKERHITIGSRLSQSNKNQNQGVHYQIPADEYVKSKFDLDQANLFGNMFLQNGYQFRFNGKKCYLDTFGNMDILSSLILCGNIWESKVSLFIKNFCSSHDTTYIDVGANIGHHIAVAKLSNAVIINAFECNPNCLKKLQNSVKINGWKEVNIFNFGLSNGLSNGLSSSDFRQNNYNIGASYITSTFNGEKTFSETPFAIETKKYDDINISIITSSILLKIDVESHELLVLKGMTTLLSDERCNTLILKLNPTVSSIENLMLSLNLIRTFGFVHFTLLFDSGTDKWASLECHHFDFLNITMDELVIKLNQNSILKVAVSKK